MNLKINVIANQQSKSLKNNNDKKFLVLTYKL